MRVAVVQFKAVQSDLQVSLDALCVLTEKAASGSDLVVLPEMASTGYLFPGPEEVRQVAEPPDGPTFRRLSPIARSARAWIVAGFPEVAPEGLYNSALVIDPAGALAFVYRKTALFEADVGWARPGDSGYRTFDTGRGTFAVGICMDLNDDVFIGWLGRRRPDVLAMPAAWLDEGHDVRPYWAWRLLGVPVTLAAANTWGEELGVRFRGQSSILAGTRLLAGAGRLGDAIIRAPV